MTLPLVRGSSSLTGGDPAWCRCLLSGAMPNLFVDLLAGRPRRRYRLHAVSNVRGAPQLLRDLQGFEQPFQMPPGGGRDGHSDGADRVGPGDRIEEAPMQAAGP